MKRYCFALDLKDDPSLIEQYQQYHQPGQVWPEIIQSIKVAGIEQLEIFLVANRLFMILQANDDFCLNNKAKMDAENPTVQEWEELMWTFQQSLPTAPGQKWQLMESIFDLKDH